MKSYYFKAALAVCAAVSTFTACQDYDAGFTEADFKKKEYADNFKSVFGNPDPNQNWSMAAVINADINLPEVNGACKVSVYTSRPGNADCKLVTAKTISNSSTISFDYPKNLSKVFIEVVNNNAVVISDYFTIENNVVVASASKDGTRAGSCPVERVFVDTKIDGFNLPDNVYADSYYNTATSGLNIVNSWDVYDIPRNKAVENSTPSKDNGIFNLYTLKNYSYTKGDGNTWQNSDLAKIIGYEGVFEESCLSSIAKGEGCAREEWYEELKPNEGIDFLLGNGGPVTLSLMYGATAKDDKFGYLYYEDGATIGEILQSPHYIVLDNAQPMNLLEYTGPEGFDKWNTISEDILHATQTGTSYTDDQKATWLSYEVTGTQIPLVYFAPDGSSSYDFPENTHIVFFEMLEVGGSSKPTDWAGKIRYSRPDMNRFYGFELDEGHTPKPSVPEHEGDWRFITYSWGETVIAGMEDTGDDDMNDLLFSVKANITNKPKDINPETPKNLKWLVACEDLGGTFDYDFNDIVVGFEKKDVEGTDHLFLQPLAAGGTLPSVISYDGYSGSGLGEIHQLLGAAPVTGENALYGTIMSKFDADQVDLGECPSDIATALKKLKINVKNQGPNSTVLESSFEEDGDETPQMLLLPGGWDWPFENTRITSVYSEFVQWAQDATYTDWTKKSTAKNDDFINNTWGK